MDSFNAVIEPIILFAILFVGYYAVVDCLETAASRIAQAVRQKNLMKSIPSNKCYLPSQVRSVAVSASHGVVYSHDGAGMRLRSR